MKFTGEIKKNSLIQEGEYEVTLTAEWAQTKAGDDYIKLTYVIRKDVEQNEQGRLVFDGIYKNKTTGAFPDDKINAILSTIPKDQVTLDFKDYDELILYINGVNMRIEVMTQKADPTVATSVDKSVCKYLSNKQTVAGPVFATRAVAVEDTSSAAEGLPF